MKKAELIFIPAPGMGHLVPTLEFAKRLIHHDDRISITVLSMRLPCTSFSDAYTNSVVASELDRIKLIDLPQAESPSFDYSMAPGAYIFALFLNHLPILKNTVKNILSSQSSSDSTQVAGLVLDFLCAPMVDFANELGIPSYIFLAASAGFLSVMMHLPIRNSQNSKKFEYSDPQQLIPGFINPVPAYALPAGLFDKDGYPNLVKIAQKFREVKGIIINTFEELEPYAINCLFNGQMPPVYPVGPVVLDITGQSDSDLELTQSEKIIKWLDDQPESSVVFLCFGSWGCFEEPQVKEIAVGLEQSGHKFLWSLRVPQPNNDAFEIAHHKNPQETLPEGFLERIQGRGMICGWAPQMEVLAHKAIGGFVSHCGWNSILESLWFGVPIVTWPMYAEQQLNAFEMVKELGLAIEMRLDYREGISDRVMADEIEKALRQLMDGGSELSKKVKEMSGMARKAIVNGGSSFISIGRLIEDMIGNN